MKSYRKGKMKNFNFCITTVLAKEISLPATWLNLKALSNNYLWCSTWWKTHYFRADTQVLSWIFRSYECCCGQSTTLISFCDDQDSRVWIKWRLWNSVLNQSLSKLPLFTIPRKVTKKQYILKKKIVDLWNTNGNAGEQSLHWIYSYLCPRVRCQLTWITYH